MSISIGPAATDDLRPRITVIGIGGAGGNAIANMIESEIEGVEFIVTNTDAQALSSSPAEKRIQLGPDITGGLGAGARPEVGKAAAEETVAEIEDALEGVNMVFIAAGMGGGTGTGAAPVIAEAARRKGVLTVGVVTKPFLFEGTRRMRAAEAGIAELQEHVDTLIVIPNQNLFLVAKPETTFKEAFQLADEVLQQGVRSITDLIVNPGLINLDFADIRAVMSEMGKAMMGTGEGEGENRALDAAEQAIANPLLDGVSMQGAKGVIISIIGGEDMTLMELDEAANYIRDLVDEDANIIWGSAFNPDMAGSIRISVVATGIDASASSDAPAMPSAFMDSRAPKRPVLELSEEDDLELEEEYQEPEAEDSEPLDLDGLQAMGDDEGEDEEDDVDGIVDPLAGLRGAEEDEDGEGGGQDDLLSDADRLAQADNPVQPGYGGGAGGGYGGGGGAGGGGGPAGGSTLFERMANLSRSTASDDDDDEDEDGDGKDGGDDDSPALSIPRFLGRQNNQ
ncbi:MAG: cell division protein FtsZ [Erythrobacteraceae bacterium]|jgi:cell division protein FtsZ|nr:cell division protein FtsZ [Erythrobacteraceae bacterium]